MVNAMPGAELFTDSGPWLSSAQQALRSRFWSELELLVKAKHASQLKKTDTSLIFLKSPASSPSTQCNARWQGFLLPVVAALVPLACSSILTEGL